MKLIEFKPGRRVHAGEFRDAVICDGILSKDIKIGIYDIENLKRLYYVKGCIIKLNGGKSWWPLSMIHYHKRS